MELSKCISRNSFCTRMHTNASRQDSWQKIIQGCGQVSHTAATKILDCSFQVEKNGYGKANSTYFELNS